MTYTRNELHVYQTMAKYLTTQPLGRHGRFPMRQMTLKVAEGTATTVEALAWYPRAVQAARRMV